MPDKAVVQGDRLEKQLSRRLASLYSEALTLALKRYKAFFQKLQDVESGKIQPPAIYRDSPELIAKWKRGFIQELMRRQQLIENIAKDLAQVGSKAEQQIRDTLREVYAVNREFTAETVSSAKGVSVSFAQYDKRQLDVLMTENESPFSKIAYRNLGSDLRIRRRLQNEMSIATMLGEDTNKLRKRIQKVTGQTAKQAMRVARTERTRVQSQARVQAMEEAAAMGIPIVYEWSTRMVNSRDTHIAMNGQHRKTGESFNSPSGAVLRYPGDPSAPAKEVINCQCVLIPHLKE